MLDTLVLPVPKLKQDKIRILCLSIWYPLSMSRYFEKALRQRTDVDLLTIGPYTGSWIPWMGGMNLPMKYAKHPDIELNDNHPNYGFVRDVLLPKGWVPDIVLTIDAGIHWKERPSDGLVAHIATDPHVLNYDFQRSISDRFFNMQRYYMQGNDLYLPYAYSHFDFYPDDKAIKDTDSVLIGMPYLQRAIWRDRLLSQGVSVIMENGPIFDEARALYNRGRIGLNWSSMLDLNCRAFELPAMKLYPVMNRVPDMNGFSFFDHCGIFDTMDEAVDLVLWAKNHPDEAQAKAELAYKSLLLGNHTYSDRIQQLLEDCRAI